MNKFIKKGFTLAEVMVALLIIAIIMAASTPIITKKTVRTRSGAGNNPWEWIPNSTNTVFNSDSLNASAIIGSGIIPDTGAGGTPLPRLVINSDDSHYNQMSLYQESAKKGDVFVGTKGCFLGNYPALSDNNVENAVVIGNVTAYNSNSVAVGNGVSASAVNSIGIGNLAKATAKNAIAIGYFANASGEHAIAVGYSSKASGMNAIALGSGTSATADNTMALGHGSTASARNSYVIGASSTISNNDCILIGHRINSGSYTSSVIIGGTSMKTIFLGDAIVPDQLTATNIYATNFISVNLHQNSDARLKNIESEYTSGMDKINQLKVYNYTFKNDPKRKRVGVIAQDLMKVFPNAVSKNEDGYYMIREEDIFYAMVNAIKELNKKISDIIESLKNPSEKSVELANKVSDLETEIKQQKNDIKILKRRILFLKLRTLCIK